MPCDAVHLYEQTFRLAALQGGLVLQPGTSPPVLERVTGWRAPALRHLADEAEARLDVVRTHLRFWGPSTIADVAGFVDTTATQVRAHWPDDVDAVDVDGEERFVLTGDEPAGDAAGVLRLLGPYDPFLQLRDRHLLVDDAAKRKALWPTIGRPGAVVVDGEVLGLWRPKTSGERLTINVQPWRRFRLGERARLDAEAQRLADFRDVTLRAVDVAR